MVSYICSSQDIDCMPLNPFENMPASFIRHSIGISKLLENWNELKIKFSPGENLESTDGSYVSPSSHLINNLLKQVKVSSLWKSNCHFLIIGCVSHCLNCKAYGHSRISIF